MSTLSQLESHFTSTPDSCYHGSFTVTDEQPFQWRCDGCGWTYAPPLREVVSQRDQAREWAMALEERLAEVRSAIAEAGENGAKYGDLRVRLAPRLLALIDRPLGEPFAGYFSESRVVSS